MSADRHLTPSSGLETGAVAIHPVDWPLRDVALRLRGTRQPLSCSQRPCPEPAVVIGQPGGASCAEHWRSAEDGGAGSDPSAGPLAALGHDGTWLLVAQTWSPRRDAWPRGDATWHAGYGATTDPRSGRLVDADGQIVEVTARYDDLFGGATPSAEEFRQ